MRANIEPKDLEKLARSIADSLGTEFYTHALVGIGTTVSGIKELARSFKEAQVALEVGKVFGHGKNHRQLRQPWYRPPAISAADNAVRYVPARGVPRFD